jgi:hypothetical protein
MLDRLFNAALAKRLDDIGRLIWLPPDDVIAALGVQPREVVPILVQAQGI